ncbi:MAG: hypothetical protein FWF15_00260 [Oscillospiraceae bacterium]|nr:hypothetical protein [Oscillospiraceae bacterium]
MITFENKYLRYSFEENGNITEFTIGGKNLSTSGNFAALYKEKGSAALTPTILLNNNILTVSFGDISFEIEVTVYDEYITYKVISASENVYKFVYGAVNISGGGTMLALNNFTETLGFPGKTKLIGAMCFGRTGIVGSQAALIAVPQERLIPLMKEILEPIEIGTMTVSRAGGPWAGSVEGANGTYIISGECPAPEKVDALLEYYRSLKITQVDFHQGGMFRQGDFHFHFPGGITEFRKFSDKLKEYGMMSGLHTYAQFIDPMSKYVTPVPYKELDAIKVYTLAEDISTTADIIKVLEDTSSLNTITGFFVRNSLYIQIGDEMIVFRNVDAEGFKNVERGALGTKVTAHKKGAQVKHMAHMFCLFVPKMDSELFLEIARNTAQAYNEGGFDMIYLDALDGTPSMIDDYEFTWYYSAKFVAEILKYTQEKPPILEYSMMTPSLWYGRTRMGALDTPFTGYKQFIKGHIHYNQNMAEAMYLSGQLGWISVYPTTLCPLDLLTGYSTRFFFEDDVDYLGAKSIAYNTGMSYIVVAAQDQDKWPALTKNTELIGTYDKLRLENYFAPHIIEQLKDLDADFKLIGNEFYRMFYPTKKLFSPGDDTFVIDNPVCEQDAGLRIESLYSLSNEEEVTLLELDENEVITEVKKDLAVTGVPLGMGVWIYGNNEGSYVSIKLKSQPHIAHGILERLIKVDFNGWKYFELVETDNGEIPEAREGKVSCDYSEFREFPPNLNSLVYIHVRVIGKNDGIKMRDIKAVSTKENVIVNPSLGGISFKAAIKSGEYLDYRAGETTANVYDKFGNVVEVADVSGYLNLKTGANTTKFKSETEGARVKLTAIIKGEKIK